MFALQRSHAVVLLADPWSPAGHRRRCFLEPDRRTYLSQDTPVVVGHFNDHLAEHHLGLVEHLVRSKNG
jgi:hypothetical protein